MNRVLEVKEVSKSIKGKEIIKNISFEIFEGQIFGFLGPNGSGKTTTIRMIVNLIRPNKGEIKICGNSISKNSKAAMSNVGCMIESPDLYEYLSGYENLMQFVRMDKRIAEQRIYEVINIVGMDNRLYDKVETYSLGMKQRLGIAQAILSKPKLLILDEPTNGLDPAGVNEFRKLIKRLSKEENMTIFLSSHLLSEVQLMCDKIAILSNGKIISTGNIDEYNQENTYVIVIDKPKDAIKILKNNLNLDAIKISENSLSVTSNHTLPHEITNLLVNKGLNINQIYLKSLSLEELFLQMTRGDEIV